MKKITFILFALITGTTFAQNSATATSSATVNAEVVSPISITPVTNLDFGRLIGNEAGGVVTIAATAAGTRTSTNEEVLALTGNTATAAKFNVIAATDYTYSVALSSTNLLTSDADGAVDMPVAFDHNLKATGNAGNGSTPIELYVGGALTVNAGQTEGAYTGEVSVTVTYE
ncbi:DUF4402 domain-containing protein [Salinimicrobium sp. 3283s]|uniref:DUF4402 domain-containing protein n=1 Tax=Salinimicrobium sp. 3283s TaxID=3114359 RepID=UPI0031E5D4A1